MLAVRAGWASLLSVFCAVICLGGCAVRTIEQPGLAPVDGAFSAVPTDTAGPPDAADSSPISDAASDLAADPSADTPAPQDATATEVSGDAAADATPTVPPTPWQATGTLHEVSELLEGPWPVDLGDKAKSEPAGSGATLDDIDGDGLADLLVHDGISHLWLFRSLIGQPWKWNKEPVLALPMNGLRTVALYREPGLPPAVVMAGSRLYYLTWQKGPGNWAEDALTRGLSVPTNVQVQSVQPADLDEDGLLDLVATVFTCGGNAKPLAFVSQGNGKFAESWSNLVDTTPASSLWNTLHTDIDGDGHPDLLAMAESCPPGTGNAYFHNRAHPAQGPRYELKALPPIFLYPKPFGGSPMGGAVADWNNDGLLDLFLTQIGLRDVRLAGTDLTKLTRATASAFPGDGNQLLLRKADGTFAQVGAQQGLSLALSETGQSMVGWTGLPVDLDADGHLDLIVSHGYDFSAFILADEGGARPVFFRNQGNGTFADLSKQIGLPTNHIGRGAALADLDNDGDLDLFLGGQSVPPRLFRNDIQTQGQTLRVRLQGTLSNPWGLGARLTLQTSARKLVAEHGIHAASLGMAAPVTQLAWPTGEQPQKLTVQWPSGFVQQVTAANWPINGKPLLVTEPALATLSSRWVPATASATVVIKARAFSEFGVPVGGPKASIELASGSLGSFDAPTLCDDVECTRTWRPPVGQTGEAAFVIQPGSSALLVRPRVRYVAQ